MPTNVELKNYPMLICMIKHILYRSNPHNNKSVYDIAYIPLDKFGLIKDFFFTIVEKEDYIANRIDKFTDALIEIEILQTREDTTLSYSKMDSPILNYYIPLKTSRSSFTE